MAYIGAAPDGQGSAERFIFTATGSTTDTVTHDDDGLAINYEANHVSVYLNGVKQVVGTDVTASNGSTLVFASNLAEDDVVEAIALSSYSPADTVPAATGGTFAGAVTFSAGLTANTADINAGTVDGVTIGTNSVCTDLRVDNIKIDGNTIISTDTNGNIDLTPNGTGEVNISKVDINGGTIDGCTITGNISGNAGGTAATVTTAAQPAITSVGTLTALTGGTGDFNWDSNTLVVDSSESRVGIGTATPSTALEIAAPSGIDSFKVTNIANYWSRIVGSSTTGQSNGLIVDSGTNSSDTSLLVRSQDGNSTYFKIRGDGNITIGTGGDLETSTTGKIKQKGAFMQSSTHQALTLGY